MHLYRNCEMVIFNKIEKKKCVVVFNTRLQLAYFRENIFMKSAYMNLGSKQRKRLQLIGKNCLLRSLTFRFFSI